MTTDDQEPTRRYASADRPTIDDRRAARALFVRDNTCTMCDAGKKVGLNPADLDSLAELVDPAGEHRERIRHDVDQRSVTALLIGSGETAWKHRFILGGVALVLALTLTGCSQDDTEPNAEDTPSATPSTPSPSAPSAPKKPEEKAAEALTNYLDVRDDALQSATIGFKRLNKVATGREFLNIQQNVRALQSSGTKVTGEYVHALDMPRRRTDSTFMVTDCEDRSGVERRRQGKAVPPPVDPEGNLLRNPLPIDYEVVREKGRWLVSNADVQWDEQC